MRSENPRERGITEAKGGTSSQRKECLPCQVLYEVREKSLSDFALWKALVTCQSNFSGDEYRGEACRGYRMVGRKADQEIFQGKVLFS